MSDQQGKSLPMAPGAMASLILGIIGLSFGLVYGIGLIPSIIGMVLGGKAKKAVAANPSGYRAPGIGKAGFILSLIGMILSIIGIIILIVAIVAIVATGTINSMMTQ